MVFEQVLALLIFVAIGFFLIKIGLAKIEHTQILSKILVYVFLPANLFKTFGLNFNKEYIFDNYKLFLFSACLVIVLNVASYFLAKIFTKNQYERSVYEYSLSTPNFGYVGYPLAESLGGTAGLLNFMTFGVPVAFCAYTLGFSKLTKRGFSLKKSINFTTISIIVGMIFGLFSIPIPSILKNTIVSASGCMGPVGMIMTGMVISQFDFKKVLSNWKIYPAILLRLVIIPLVIGFVLKLFASDLIVKIAVLFYCLPCGLNTVIFPKLVGENCETGASLAMLSTILSLATIPFICNVFGIG